MKIGVLDYGAGNIRSVELALHHLKADWLTSSRADELTGCDKLIIPGDGHAASSMENLRSRGLVDFLRDYQKKGRWILGVCIGCQIILDRSDEAPGVECLGLIPGTCHRLPGGPGIKVPHMGWNNCVPQYDHFLFKGVPKDASFYYVHSYYTQPDRPEDILGLCDHGISFPAALGRDSVWAFQFHPEKSGPWGLKLLQNYLEVR